MYIQIKTYQGMSLYEEDQHIVGGYPGRVFPLQFLNPKFTRLQEHGLHRPLFAAIRRSYDC